MAAVPTAITFNFILFSYAGHYRPAFFLTFLEFTKSSQKISTHLLTVLIMRAIVQLEQKKGNKKKSSSSGCSR